VAALDEPPPRPPPIGRRLSILISAPLPAGRRSRRWRPHQQTRGANDQILLIRHAGHRRQQAQLPSDAVRWSGIAIVEKLKQRLQGVVTIGPLAGDIKTDSVLQERASGHHFTIQLSIFSLMR
jgi:hypothetical protein